jgi:hypothetical protein
VNLRKDHYRNARRIALSSSLESPAAARCRHRTVTAKNRDPPARGRSRKLCGYLSSSARRLIVLSTQETRVVRTRIEPLSRSPRDERRGLKSRRHGRPVLVVKPLSQLHFIHLTVAALPPARGCRRPVSRSLERGHHHTKKKHSGRWITRLVCR